MSETQKTISAWVEETFGSAGSNAAVVSRAGLEFAELQFALCTDDRHPKAGEEMADVVICLYRLADRMGYDLQAEIDKKMKTNRSRTWKKLADGFGQHVEETSQ